MIVIHKVRHIHKHSHQMAQAPQVVGYYQRHTAFAIIEQIPCLNVDQLHHSFFHRVVINRRSSIFFRDYLQVVITQVIHLGHHHPILHRYQFRQVFGSHVRSIHRFVGCSLVVQIIRHHFYQLVYLQRY